MNKNNLFGIGIVFVMLLVFAPHAAADNVVYFDPDPSCAAPGEEITVTLWFDTVDGAGAFNDAVHFDPSVVNITSGTPGDFPLMWGFVHYGDYVKIGGWTPDGLDRTGHLKLADLTFKANGIGTSTVYHDDNGLFDQYGWHVPNQQWINGTFNSPCLTPETFTMPLPNEGWNLISLPLTPTDNSVGAVLSTVSYDAVRQYDTTINNFTNATTMDPGTGYFVHVTTAGTWEYEGTAYISMTASLSEGLNCVGWVSETGSALPGALSSIDGSYWYVSRWNADTQSYEVYLPDAPDDIFNDFATMDRGEGYFISATNGCTLTYP